MENPSVPIIYTSSYNAEVEGKDLGLHEGVNFLQKPYASHKLAQMLRETLDEEAADHVF
jgi:hypothetical protein